jgi:C1A family cysteine protease
VVAGDSNADYYNLADAQLIDLLQKGPVAISINSDGWVNYGSGTYECYNSQVNHAVLLIGYTSDYWIIKNQWGSLWGMEGFMKISRIPSKNCGIGYSAHVLLGEGNSANDKYYTTDSNGTASNTLDNLGLS